MSILSGIKKVIPYFKNADGNYEQLSYKTSSQTVDFDDGNTAETKLGAINGITKSLNSTSDNVAISASAGKSLQDQITALNSNIKIKKKDVALTTDGNGTAKTDLNADDFVLLQISLRENSYYKCVPILNGSSANTWWIAVTDLFGSVVANKLVNFTLYYQYISKD